MVFEHTVFSFSQSNLNSSTRRSLNKCNYSDTEKTPKSSDVLLAFPDIFLVASYSKAMVCREF